MCEKLRAEGKYADEIVELPDGGLVVVERALRPKSRDASQAIETLKKLYGLGRRVVGVAVVGKAGFHKMDRGIMVQALRVTCGKHKVKGCRLLTPGQNMGIGSYMLEAKGP